MAFPQVEATSSYSTDSQDTTHVIGIPTGTVDGDVLVAIFAGTGTPSHSPPASWTTLLQPTSTFRTSVHWKIASSEGADFTITTSTGTRASARVFRISGATSVEADVGSGSDTAAPDPPSLTPSWGSQDTLWIAVVGALWVNNLSVTAPTNYANVLSRNTQFIETGAVVTAQRENSVATEDPAAFAISASEPSLPLTIAVEPAGGGGGGVSVPKFMAHYRRMRAA